MQKSTITLRRDNGIEGFMSNQTLGTDGFNAMSTLPGVKNLQVVNETEDLVTLSFDWDEKKKFLAASEHLRKYGVTWVDPG